MARGGFIDITGQTFHRLTVTGRSEDRGTRGEVLWDCLCECGEEATVRSAFLRYGRQKSCGCARVEWGKEVHKLGIAAKERKALEAQTNQENLTDKEVN